jgi:hypothetical protein
METIAANLVQPQGGEVNIPGFGLSKLYVAPQFDACAQNLTFYNPRSSTISATASAIGNGFFNPVSNTLEWLFTTSNGVWLDLFNSYFRMQYTTATSDALSAFIHPMMNNIGQAYLYINGIQVSFTNNWTINSKINKRTCFSKKYNNAVHKMNYQSNIDLTTYNTINTANGVYVPPFNAQDGVNDTYNDLLKTNKSFYDVEFLDGFFMRDRQNCYVPPCSEIRLVVIADPAGIRKAIKHATGAGETTTYTINNIVFVGSSIYRELPEKLTEWKLKLTTNTLTATQLVATATAINYNLSVSPNTTKINIAFQAPQFATVAVGTEKPYTGDTLCYNDITGVCTQNELPINRSYTGVGLGATVYPLTTLQIQLGTSVYPQQQLDCAATGDHTDFWLHYMRNNNKTWLTDSGDETFIDWLAEPIYTFSIIRPDSDRSTNLIVRGTLGTAPANAPFMYIISEELQIVSFTFDETSGGVVSTTIN